MLVSYLYATPMRSRLDEIRPGVGYRFEAPTADMLIKGYEANKALEGGLNIHIPITFDDGVKWLVRARKLNPEVDKTFQQLGLANELHTISLLRAIAPEFIPNAWASTQHPCECRLARRPTSSTANNIPSSVPHSTHVRRVCCWQVVQVVL